MRKRVLVTGTMLREGFSQLEQEFDVIYPKDSAKEFSREELLSLVGEFDALLSMFFTKKIDKEILDRADRVKIIANFGVGYDNVDVNAATERGIVVTNTPDPVTEPTAELAMGLMIAAARRVCECDRHLRSNTPYRWGALERMGYTLYGKRLGIIGMGRIGQSLARRAVACGMTIVYHNRTRLDKSIEERYGAAYVSMDELLCTSDVVSLNAPATPQTFHIIGADQLRMMKSSAILINTARGNLVDEKALVEALRNKIIYSAGLDVYEAGDGNVTPQLFDLDNVVIVPHIGTQTIDTRNEMAAYASQNIINFFNGQPLLSPVNSVLSVKK